MKNKSLVSITDFTKEEYLRILELAAEFEEKPRQDILKGYVISTLFLSLPPAPGSVLKPPSTAWAEG
jgi:aspartate carbamoyltransferase catalytic subunit